MSSVAIDQNNRSKSLKAVAIGNALEWFDWTLYGIFSVYLARNLFDNTDKASALLATLAVFAGGFIARPIGGWVFGAIGDRYGRKLTLIMTMSLLALTSLAIALIPTYAQIGVGASILLFLCRLTQGLAHGGESGVAFTYVAEIAPKEKRGLWSSSVFVSVMVGVMGATALAAFLTKALSADAMEAWGWRAGFAAGALLGVYALVLRRSASESAVFEEHVAKTDGPKLEITGRQAARIALNIVMLGCASNAAYYTWVTFAPATAIATRGMDASGAYIASLLAQFACILWLPVCGLMSDRFGRKPLVMAWGLGVILFTIPIDRIVTSEPWTLFVAQVMGLGAWSLLAAIFPALLAEQIPTQARARGVGFVSSLSVAIFGGTAPYLNTWLNTIGLGHVYLGYIMALGAVACIASLMIRETAGVDLNDITVPSVPAPKRAALASNA